MKQQITSAETSVHQIPALHRWVVKEIGSNLNDDTIVDYGCGKYNDGIEFLKKHTNSRVLPYDPYHRDEVDNAIAQVHLNGSTVLVANVLNVIKEQKNRESIIKDAAKGKIAFFTVYEGNGSGEGKKTTKGWQNNRKTATYVDEIATHFNNVVRKGKVIIAVK